MAIEILHDVKPPLRRLYSTKLVDLRKGGIGRPALYPWADMRPGDCIEVPTEKATSAWASASRYAEANGVTFTRQRHGIVTRIWRIADTASDYVLNLTKMPPGTYLVVPEQFVGEVREAAAKMKTRRYEFDEDPMGGLVIKRTL